MKPFIDADGVQVQTFEEIYDQLVAQYKLIYGNDINTEVDSPDGQRIAIEAKALLDLQTYGAIMYNEMDPDLADGLSLERLIKLSGIQRRPSSLSQVDVDINTDRSLTLAAGYKVEDDIGQIWITDSSFPLVSGVNTVTLFAENFGAVEGLANTITEPVTIIAGILSVNNPLAATVGQNEETDAELRVRRILSLKNPATSTTGGLFSVLGNLPNVTALQIYENDTDFYDNVLLLEAHSLWIVIEGGSIDDIAEAIVKNKTGGTGLKGDTEGTYQEIIELANGLIFDNTSTVEFDRPAVTEIYVKADITTTNSTTPNETIIKDAIARQRYNIGQDAVASTLYCNIYSAQNNLVVTNLEISLDDIIYTDDVLDANAQWLFNIDVNNITLNIT